MGKQLPSAPRQPPNVQLFTRLSHLYQAANALALPPTAAATAPTESPAVTAAKINLSRFYLSQMRSVAKKSVLRLDPSIKRTVCKRCDTLLVPGVSCKHRVENPSKNGKKRWADVLVVECNKCGALKRFPVGMDELKAKRGKPFKLWSERGTAGGKQEEKKVDPGNPTDKKGGKKGGGKAPQVFKMPGIPDIGKPVDTVGVRDAMEEKPVVSGPGQPLDVEMGDA